jgi:anti-sigma regulatory factor (Ser/Thr protein kinase)
MEADVTLQAAWLGDGEAIPILDEASVSEVRQLVRREGARVALGEIATAALVNVASELAHNQLAHARGGAIAVREAPRGGSRGLEVVAADKGCGIRDLARALQGRPSGNGRSLGVGLSAVCELADEVDIDVRLGEGTCVRARKFPDAHSRRTQIGVFGRAFPGESVSGDDAAFVRSGDDLTIGVVDGLGHGWPAREAASRATWVLRERSLERPEAILAACDGALAQTRGAVMSVARLDGARGIELASVGNVSAHLYTPFGSRRFGGSSFVLGAPGGARRIATERETLDRFGVLAIFTDGIRSRVDLSGELALLREHPAVVAQQIVERFGRPDDDVLVLVAS